MIDSFWFAGNPSRVESMPSGEITSDKPTLLIPSQDRLLPVADEVDMICGQANSAAIERPVRRNSTLPMPEGPYAKCWLSCIAGLA